MLRFTNPGEIDARLITTLGVNVKDGDNAIGFFGTGLKYAIAGLLRTGQTIEIWSGLTRFSFEVQPTTIRGKDFGFITMTTKRPDGSFETGLPLGFTTDLGKTWESWMFYRELASNTIDEHGTIEQSDAAKAAPGQTVILVSGLDEIHRNRQDIFLQTKPLATDLTEGELHRKDPANGLSNYLYYRGVRVATMPQQMLFNYNLTAKIDLTEDRTVKSMWHAGYRIENLIMRLGQQNEKELETILLAPEGTFEQRLDLGHSDLGDNAFAFLDQTTERLMAKHLGRLNPGAVSRILKRRKATPTPAKMTKVEQQQLALARHFLRDVLSIEITVPVAIADSLGERVYGLATEGQIFVSRLAFDRGTKFVAVVLVEEWLHAERGLRDFDRDFQTWVLEKMVSLGEELQGKPL